MDRPPVDSPCHAAEEVKLCDRCTFALSQTPEEEGGRPPSLAAKPTHHRDGFDMLKAADGGCRVCQLSIAELQSWFGTDKPLEETLRELHGTWFYWTRDYFWQYCDLEIIVSYTRRGHQGYYLLARLRIEPLDPTPPEGTPRFHPPSEFKSTICGTISSDFTGSDACWTRVLAWYHDCLQNHTKCGKLRSFSGQKAAWYPTRLLDVGVQTDQAVRLTLTETSACEGPYMTLSHRWGTGPMYRLTSATLPTLLAGVGLSELPRTFREAIEVTRRLGVRYLWIDSLCIIQDSVDDWQKESAQMVHVYSNSHLNIAATAAENAEQGLFRRRQADPLWPWQVRATFDDGLVRRSLMYDREMLLKGLTRAPLNRRAWVVQERLLAPRVLHFAASQLFWECHQRTASEMFPVQLPDTMTERAWGFQRGLGKSMDLDHVAQTNFFFPSLPPSQHRFRMWDLIVSQYMNCAITNPEDKLVAISGLAQHVAGMLGHHADTYLAGLWKSRLPRQLLWAVTNCKQADRTPSFRPSVYRAPSWSWASVEGRVDMFFSGDAETRDLATLRDVSVAPLNGGEAFGQVVGGSIKLRGMLLTGLRIRHADGGIRGEYVVDGVEQDERWAGTQIHPDVPQDGAALATQWLDCMPIAREKWTGLDGYVDQVFCLLLRPATRLLGSSGDTGACYERVGVAWFTEDSLAVWNDDDAGADMLRRAGCELVPEVDITIV